MERFSLELFYGIIWEQNISGGSDIEINRQAVYIAANRPRQDARPWAAACLTFGADNIRAPTGKR
ncbi:hypothetical protein DPQ22_07345 [Candidatus Tokpelaia sp.]|nr:hypothetical protein DPQ22_07345 [Candidatus Tokpelaia sp.]